MIILNHFLFIETNIDFFFYPIVDSMTWKQLIELYPQLVEVGSISGGAGSPPQLWKALKHVLLQYTDLLQPPTKEFFKAKEKGQINESLGEL